MLYGAQTQRALNNFAISGLTMPRYFIRALGLIKFACAKANSELGELDKTVGKIIANEALQVARGEYDSQFQVDVFQTGSGTSTNMNANEVIAALANKKMVSQQHASSVQPIHPNDHVNRGQSSNDVIPSAIHVSADLAVIETLLPALRELEKSIEEKAGEYQTLVKTGRTHLMDAMPLTVAQELSGWQTQIINNIQRIKTTLPRLRQIAIGATAVGTGVNAKPGLGARVAELLTEASGQTFTPTNNYYEALSCQDTSLELSGSLRTTASSLLKICNDLRWMSSGPLAGLGEVTLPALQPGSSIMPGKVNPVIPEAVAMVAAQVTGNDATITAAAQSGNFQLNVMLPVIAYNLLQSIELLANSARALANKCIVGMTYNREKIQFNLAQNPVLVTALNHIIGYEKSADIAKRAYKEGRPILDVAIEMTDLDPKDLKKMLDPANLVSIV